MVFVVRTMSWSLIARAGLWTYIAFFLAQVKSFACVLTTCLLTLFCHQGVTLAVLTSSMLKWSKTAFLLI